MKRRMMLGLTLAVGVPTGVFARHARKHPIEVLETHLANPLPAAREQRIGQPLRLRRVHDRAFDPAAISVETEQGLRLGYLPPVQAGVLSRLLDHGANASARFVTRSRVQVLLHLS